MSINYNSELKRFTIETKNTRYVLDIVKGKYPIHIYYGQKNDSIEL